MGSASEVEYQLLLARDLGLLDEAACQRLSNACTEVKRMLTALINKLKAEG
jgi:four helix bundle protein